MKNKKIYQKIIYERLSIYMIGMITGVILGIYYLLTNPNDNYRICKFLCIIYIVKLGIYYFYPKSPLMLYLCTKKEQIDAWADIYTENEKFMEKILSCWIYWLYGIKYDYLNLFFSFHFSFFLVF